MKSKPLLLLLFVLFVILLSIVLFTDSKEQMSSSFRSQKITSFLSKDEIDRVRIIGKFGSYDINRTTLFEKKISFLSRADWVLREPLFAPVDSSAIEKLLQLVIDFSGEPVSRDQIDQSQLSEYGIEPPDVVLIINKGDYKEAFSLGSINSVTKRFFVKKESDQSMSLADESILKNLQDLLSKIRSQKVLSFDVTSVKRIDVLREDSFFRLQSNCESPRKWTITSDGLDLRVQDDFLEREIAELSEMRVKRIYDNPIDILQFTGLANPILVFKLEFAQKQEGFQCGIESEKLSDSKDGDSELIFQIGKGVGIQIAGQTQGTAQTYYLKIVGENVIYEIEKATIGDWMQSPDHFRNKKPFVSTNNSSFSHLELSIPSRNCSVLSDIKNIDKMTDIFKEFSEMEFDMYVQTKELSNFDPMQGMSFYMKSQTCSQGFETTGVISQTSVSGEKIPVASVLKIKNCKEPELYGVISLTRFKNFADSVTTLCN